MAVKPIIEIEINDSAFRDFYEKFKVYSDELKDMPESWRELGNAMGEGTKQLEAGAISSKDALAIAAAQAGVIAEAIRDAAKAQNEFNMATKTGEKNMDGLRKATEGVGKAISAMGGWILKLGAMAVLGGVAAFAGMADLAGDAFQRQRASGRLGLSAGQLKSFEINAQQFLGPEALQSAFEAQGDSNKWAALQLLGISPSRAQGMATPDLAFEELRKAAAVYRQDQRAGMRNWRQDPRLAMYQSILGGDLGQVVNAANNSGQLDIAQRKYHDDIRTMELTQKQLQAMTDFKIALDRATSAIGTALIGNLSVLAPALTKLSTTVADLITQFIKSKEFGKAIDIANGSLKLFSEIIKKFIDWLAPWFDSDEQKKKTLDTLHSNENKEQADFLRKIGHGIIDAAGKLTHPEEWLSSSPSSNPLTSGNDTSTTGSRTAWAASVLKGIGAPITPQNLAFMDQWQAQEGSTASYNPLNTTQPAPGSTNFNSVGVRNYTSSSQGFNATLKTLQNGYYPDIVASLKSGNPWGNSQVPHELDTWGTGSGWYKKGTSPLKDLINSAMKTVDEDIKKYGKSWASHLPQEVHSFVSSLGLSAKTRSSSNVHSVNYAIQQALARAATKPTHIYITNQTPARVAVSVNAGAQ